MSQSRQTDSQESENSYAAFDRELREEHIGQDTAREALHDLRNANKQLAELRHLNKTLSMELADLRKRYVLVKAMNEEAIHQLNYMTSLWGTEKFNHGTTKKELVNKEKQLSSMVPADHKKDT